MSVRTNSRARYTLIVDAGSWNAQNIHGDDLAALCDEAAYLSSRPLGHTVVIYDNETDEFIEI